MIPDGPTSRLPGAPAVQPADGHNSVVIAQGGTRWGATCPCMAQFTNDGRGYASASDAFTAWAHHRQAIIEAERGDS